VREGKSTPLLKKIKILDFHREAVYTRTTKVQETTPRTGNPNRGGGKKRKEREKGGSEGLTERKERISVGNQSYYGLFSWKSQKTPSPNGVEKNLGTKWVTTRGGRSTMEIREGKRKGLASETKRTKRGDPFKGSYYPTSEKKKTRIRNFEGGVTATPSPILECGEGKVMKRGVQGQSNHLYNLETGNQRRSISNKGLYRNTTWRERENHPRRSRVLKGRTNHSKEGELWGVAGSPQGTNGS